MLTFTAGTALIMWLGEQINDKGVGNGISIILFAGIVSRLPVTCRHRVAVHATGHGEVPPPPASTLILAPLFVVLFLVVDLGHRLYERVPSAASPSSTPSAWWAAKCMAARAPYLPD